jgi:hypothetical protein
MSKVIATPNGLDPSIANAVPVLNWGVVGTDASANAPAIPIPGYVLLSTIVSTIARATFAVQNQSAYVLQIVIDDGFGNSPTSWLVDPSPYGAGRQGGWLGLSNEKGRIQIYGPVGAQFGARSVGGTVR